MPHVTQIVALSAGVAVLAACSALIGIDEAQVDPNLNLGGAGPDASAGGGVGGQDTGGGGGQAGSGGAAAGAGGSSAGAAGTAGAGGAADSGTVDPCSAYCDLVMENCAADPVYASKTVCKAVCSTLPVGSPSDDSGNTVYCRLRSAELAGQTGETAVYCPAAGPGGDDRCGTNCDGYCSVMQTYCDTFASESACLTACADVNDLGGYTTSTQAGDSIQCRLYHVSAASLDPKTHCPHAAGEQICVAPMP